MKNNEAKIITLNRAQFDYSLVKPNSATLIWGRGTGKTTGPGVEHCLGSLLEMPRSNGAIIGATFSQILTRTLPPIVAQWEAMGFVRDVHFVIGKKPIKKLNFAKAYVQPLDHKYYISWFNGSGIYLVSQDRPGSSNGISIDWIYGDEAKFLKKQRLDDELLPSMRGNRSYFEGNHRYQGVLFTSDMPTTKEGMWLLANQSRMNLKHVEFIRKLAKQLMHLQGLIPSLNATNQRKALSESQAITAMLSELRASTYLYSEFSSFDNVEVLGEATLKRWKREMSPMAFQTSVLNQRLNSGGLDFYPMLDPEKHYYSAHSEKYLDSLNYDFSNSNNVNWKQDADLNTFKPLDIACDFGGSINTLVVAQEHYGQGKYRELRFLNCFYRNHPGIIQDVVLDFCNYYDSYPIKIVNFYYDHTAVAAYANTKSTYAISVVEAFRKLGWKVNEVYMGQTAKHHVRYQMWQDILKGDGLQIPLPRFNRNNCYWLITSMENAKIKESNKGVQKDKGDEQKDMDQRKTTHFSDAADTLLVAKYANKIIASADISEPIFL